MTVLASVCRLGESMCVGVRGGALEGYVFCYYLYYGFSFGDFLIQYVCLSLSV